jgi:hypothetical protein
MNRQAFMRRRAKRKRLSIRARQAEQRYTEEIAALASIANAAHNELSEFLAPPRVPEWDPANLCPACGMMSARILDGITWCTSIACDPHQLTFRALDRHYSERARWIAHTEPARD